MPLVHKDLPRAYYVPGAVRTGEFCNKSTGQMCPPSGAAVPWGRETLNTATIGALGTGWHLAGSGQASELRGVEGVLRGRGRWRRNSISDRGRAGAKPSC